MKNFTSLTIVLFLFSLITLSQEKPCGTDHVVNKILEKNPEKIVLKNQLESFTKNFVSTNKGTNRMNENYIIPVVVHVIHNYGEENISDEQVARAIETINEDWNAENDDITQTIEEFSEIVADFGVEFRLATKDPDGNCTYGITRTVSPLTEGNDEAARTLVSWPDQNYVNIFVIKSMSPGSSAAAYAFYPGMGDPNDCIVSTHTYFGHGVGTAGGSNYVKHTMSHEMGHFMNLAHPWGSTNSQALPENCLEDDGVEDTPNTIGSNLNCNLSQATCGSLDNVQNIMDYASCATMFTEGQKERVHAALNSYYRENLWQEDNLILTGVDDATFNSNELYSTCAPIPDFNTSTNTGCQGKSIDFTDYSYNGDNIFYYWDFGSGASPQFSNDKNPSVIYNEKGTHDVTLTVCNGPIDNTDSFCREITRQNYMYILDDVIVSDNGIKQNFEPTSNGSFPENDGWYIFPQENEETWEITTSGSWNDETSIRIRSRYFGYELVSHSFTTPELDLSNLSSARLYFNLAYALKSNQTDFEGNLYIQDQLIIYTSDDCGETWMPRKTYDVDDLITVFNEYGNPQTFFNDFIPEGNEENPGDWSQKEFSLNNIAGDEGVIVKFEFTGIGMDENGVNVGGNWLYIDNLRIGQNFVDIINDEKITFNIYPNPSNGNANIEIGLNAPEKVKVDICNILGKSIAIKEFDLRKGSNQISINDIHSNIPTGNYFVNVITNKEKLSRSVLITD